jgi:hypothetical protein
MSYKYYCTEYEARIEKTISGSRIKVISRDNNPCKNFKKPETESKPKIYIIKADNSLIYIGKTNQPIASRLRQGLSPKKFTGYHGYKWKTNKKIKIVCITLEIYDNIELESIEAELVYNYRNRTGSWPLSQTEIHFHNNKKAKKISKELFEKIYK